MCKDIVPIVFLLTINTTSEYILLSKVLLPFYGLQLEYACDVYHVSSDYWQQESGWRR